MGDYRGRSGVVASVLLQGAAVIKQRIDFGRELLAAL
jgi:hypothetical protein